MGVQLMKRLALILLSVLLLAFNLTAQTANNIRAWRFLPPTCDPRTGNVVYLTTGNSGFYSCTNWNVWRRADTSRLFNIEAFGATPNDISDDTAAIQATINAAATATGTVLVPYGTYRHTGLTIPNGAGIAIVGTGWSAAGPAGSVLFNTDLTTRSIEINWNPAANNAVTIADLCIDSDATAEVATSMGIWATNCPQLVIERCKVSDHGGYGIYLFECAGATVKDCYVTGHGRSGVVVSMNGDNVRLSGIKSYNNARGTSNNHCNIILTADAAANENRNITVENCDLRDAGRGSWGVPPVNAFGLMASYCAGLHVRDVFASNSLAENIVVSTTVRGALLENIFSRDGSVNIATVTNAVLKNVIMERLTVASALFGTGSYVTVENVLLLGGATDALNYGVAFAALGTPNSGTMVYCNDCTIASPCAAGGTGALAKRLNAVWVCN